MRTRDKVRKAAEQMISDLMQQEDKSFEEAFQIVASEPEYTEELMQRFPISLGYIVFMFSEWDT